MSLLRCKRWRNIYMSENKYDRMPQAGDLERESDTEVFYLSPKPLPTGMPAFSSRQLHRESNEVFLDYAVSRGTFEFASRGSIGSVMFILIFFFVVGFGLGVADYVQHGDPIFEIILTLVLPNWYMWGIVGFLVTMYGSIFIYFVRQVSIRPPIRFNRQRREVAFAFRKGEAPRYIPWEEVIACVSVGQTATQYAVTPSFALMIGLRDANTGDVLWVTVPTATLALALAVSEWEAIRAYMEEGVSALPEPQPEEYEEGTVAYFNLCRQVYRTEHSYLRYLFGFLAIQFFSGWHLPCHISAWVNRRPKASFPRELLDWSQPLPSEQWAVASEALKKQSADVRKAFAKGQTLLDYFMVINLWDELWK
ncbi:DUF6708 domain-containing protein [Stutzerimonas urumqiensis]|uniref:DUF6708 domain-containing protein n=1 Tax=Stutzerimonas urumqiensis TaxID=638269 RepID=UPI003BA934A8